MRTASGQLPPLNTPAVARRFAEGLGLPAAVVSDVETLSRFGVGGPSRPNPATAARWRRTRRMKLREFRRRWRRERQGGGGSGGLRKRAKATGTAVTVKRELGGHGT
ncbi:unnamed protein product, partial [Ectocarpus sp. 8 AP-2014]